MIGLEKEGKRPHRWQVPKENDFGSEIILASAKECLVKDKVIYGADFYEADAERARLLAEGWVPIGIGENTTIRKCIIDKNAQIGRNVMIINSEGV